MSCQSCHLEKLTQEMPFQWKVQTANDYGCQMVAYIDSRQAQDILNEFVGAENWQTKFENINGHLFCSVGIKCGDEWVWKSDVGTVSDIEGVKGEASDAFKRACVHWGIGRFLYDLTMIRIPSAKNNKGKPAPARVQNDDSSIFKPWEKTELNDFCMEIYNGKQPAKPKPVIKPKPKKDKTPLVTPDQVFDALLETKPDGMVVNMDRVNKILAPMFNGDIPPMPLAKTMDGLRTKYGKELYIEDTNPY